MEQSIRLSNGELSMVWGCFGAKIGVSKISIFLRKEEKKIELRLTSLL